MADEKEKTENAGEQPEAVEEVVNEAPETEDAGTEPEETAAETGQCAEDELAGLRKQLEELQDRHLRMLAEYDNYRRRTARDLDARGATARGDVIAKILPVLDNFDRAVAVDASDGAKYKDGVVMIYNQLKNVLDGLGVTSYGEAGDTFDPNLHMAALHTEDENYGENEITDVFTRGYKLGEKVIRPATVKVAN